MDTKNAALTNSSKKLRKEAEVFSLNVQKRKKKRSSKVGFASEISFGLVEDSFFNSTVFFSTNRQKFVTQYPKKIRNFFPKQFVCLKMFWWTRKRTQFQQICRRFRQKTWSFFSWIKGCAKKYSFQKKSPQTFPMDAKNAVSTTLVKLCLQKADSFSFIVSKWKKNCLQNYFFNTILFLDTWNAGLTKLSEFFRQNSGKFLLNSRQW